MADNNKSSFVPGADGSSPAAAETHAVPRQEDPGHNKCPKQQRVFLRLLRWMGIGLGGLAVFCVLCLAGLYGALQTETVQSFIREKANSALALRKGQEGVGIALTELSGSIPLRMHVGLKLADSRGVWLEIPACTVSLDISHPLQRLTAGCTIEQAALLRQPVLPPTAEPEETSSSPSSPAEIRAVLAGIREVTGRIPSWVPELGLSDLTVSRLHIARQVYAGEEAGTDITLSLAGALSLTPGKEAGQKSWSQAAIDSRITLTAAPVPSPASDVLCPLLAGVSLGGEQTIRLTASGLLTSPRVNLEAASPALSVQKLTARGTSLSLQIPDDFADKVVAGQEGSVALLLTSSVDGRLLSFGVTAGAALKDTGFELALHDVKGNIPGIHVSGDVAVQLKPDCLENQAAAQIEQESGTPVAHLQALAAVPLVSMAGGLAVSVTDWSIINALVPAAELSGPLDIRLGMQSREQMKADVLIQTPRLVVKAQGKEVCSVRGLDLKAGIAGVLPALPDTTVHVRMQKLEAGGMHLHGVGADISGYPDKEMQFSLVCAGDVEAKTAGKLRLDAVDIAELRVRYPALRLGIDATRRMHAAFSSSGIKIADLALNLTPAGSLTFDGEISSTHCLAKGSVRNVSLAAWQALVPALPSGQVEADFRLEGTPEAPKGKLTIKAGNIVIPKAGLSPLDAVVRADIGRDAAGQCVLVDVDLPQKTLAALYAQSAEIQVRVPLAVAPGRVPLPDINGALRGHVAYEGSLDRLWTATGLTDQKLTGQMTAKIALGGTLANPSADGSFACTNGKFRDIENGILVKDIALQAVIEGPVGSEMLKKNVRLSFAATDGRKGRIAISGTGALTGERLQLSGVIQDFAPLHRPDLQCMLSGELHVDGSAFAPSVTGKIQLDKGALYLDRVSVPNSVQTLPVEELPVKKTAVSHPMKQPKKTVSQKQEVPPASGTALSAVGGRLDVHFTMPPRFAVTGFGLTSLWKADLYITGPLTSPAVNGAVEAANGNINLLGKQFTLETGRVLFHGDVNPLLDIKLTRSVQDIVAAVVIAGTPDKIALTFTSTPEMEQEEIISRILFNRGKSELTQYELLQLGASMVQLATGHAGALGLKDKVMAFLGVDVLDVDTTNEKSTTVEIGKYVGKNLYVGAKRNTGNDKTSAVIKYELTPNTSVSVETGGSNTSAGVNWKMNY